MSSKRPMISVVSPVYGCRNCLDDLCREVAQAFEGRDLEWELVLVDDRGPDEPWDVILDLAGSRPNVRGVRMARNHGQHLAIWAGFSAARGDWVAVLDCDLQDDPAVIPELHGFALESGVDAVIVDRGQWVDTRLRRLASHVFYKVVDMLAGIRLRNVGNFGLYSRRMVNMLLMYQEQEVFLPMMVVLTGLRTESYHVPRRARDKGKSAYDFVRLLSLAAAIIVRFSDRPLKLSIAVGMLLSISAAIISVALIIGRLAGILAVPGWTSIVLSTWFLAGIILAVLGVHGFYIGRIFAEVRNRPRIVVETTTFEDTRS